VSKLLITGGAGFIGANFVLYWRRLHPNDSIIVLDALTYAGNQANLDAMREDKQFEFVHGSRCPLWWRRMAISGHSGCSR
jgi:dTDP-glucose 4,6-dehydratase